MFEENFQFKVGDFFCLTVGDCDDLYDHSRSVVIKNFNFKEEARHYIDELDLTKSSPTPLEFVNFLKEKGFIQKVEFNKILESDIDCVFDEVLTRPEQKILTHRGIEKKKNFTIKIPSYSL